MYIDEHMPANHGEPVAKKLEDIQKEDKGYNTIYRIVKKADGTFKRKRIPVYSSGCMGNHIRDAESGQFYHYRVGTCDEDLFFSTILATGECTSANGSSTLFYLSPQHCMNHLGVTISDNQIASWECKRDARLMQLNP